MKSLRAFLHDLRHPFRRAYPCDACGLPLESPEARLLHAVFTQCYGVES